MLLFLVPSALLLFSLIVLLTLRAQLYVRQHPELITRDVPASYRRCHDTLSLVVERYHQLKPEIETRNSTAWQDPTGHFYRVDGTGVEEHRDQSVAGRYRLAWASIGGVGLRMQPGFTFVDENGNHQTDSIITSGYAFYLLIVPVRGRTISLRIPTHGSTDAVDFVANTLAIAERMHKRINVFGFERPAAPTRQRPRRF